MGAFGELPRRRHAERLHGQMRAQHVPAPRIEAHVGGLEVELRDAPAPPLVGVVHRVGPDSSQVLVDLDRQRHERRARQKSRRLEEDADRSRQVLLAPARIAGALVLECAPDQQEVDREEPALGSFVRERDPPVPSLAHALLDPHRVERDRLAELRQVALALE